MVFLQGEQLAGIYYHKHYVKVGRDCDSIIVSMENGQMAEVPWFEVWKDGKIIQKWNAGKREGVSYLDVVS